MNSEYAKVILDSVAPNGKRITTLECRYWRAIHSEVMTHRVFSRNAASSRAIPFEKMIQCPVCKGNYATGECYDCGDEGKVLSPKCTLGMLENDPFIPEYIGAEQKGMQSGEQLNMEQIGLAQNIITDLLQYSIKKSKQLHELGVHKSIINRYLEPWSYITVVITSTEWENFFNLRCHPAAEKHLQKISRLMMFAMGQSTPTPLAMGDWHLPYIVPGEDVDDILLANPPGVTPEEITEQMIRVSTARCARVSYLNQDGNRDIADDLALYSRLRNPGDGVMHASPFEHAATPAAASFMRSGNFQGWQQHRKTIPGEDGIR